MNAIYYDVHKMSSEEVLGVWKSLPEDFKINCIMLPKDCELVENMSLDEIKSLKDCIDTIYYTGLNMKEKE